MTHKNTPPAPQNFITRLAAICAFAFAAIFAIPAAADDWQVLRNGETNLAAPQGKQYTQMHYNPHIPHISGETRATIEAGFFYITASISGAEFGSPFSGGEFFFDESTLPATLTTTITAAIPPEEQLHTAVMTAGATQTIIAPPSPTLRTITMTVITATAVYHLRRIDERPLWLAHWIARHEIGNNPQAAVISVFALLRNCAYGTADCTFAPTKQTINYAMQIVEQNAESLDLGESGIIALGRGKLPPYRNQIDDMVGGIMSAVYREDCHNSDPTRPCEIKTNAPYTADTVKWIIAKLVATDYDGVIPANWGATLLAAWRNRNG